MKFYFVLLFIFFFLNSFAVNEVSYNDFFATSNSFDNERINNNKEIVELVQLRFQLLESLEKKSLRYEFKGQTYTRASLYQLYKNTNVQLKQKQDLYIRQYGALEYAKLIVTESVLSLSLLETVIPIDLFAKQVLLLSLANQNSTTSLNHLSPIERDHLIKKLSASELSAIGDLIEQSKVNSDKVISNISESIENINKNKLFIKMMFVKLNKELQLLLVELNTAQFNEARTYLDFIKRKYSQLLSLSSNNTNIQQFDWFTILNRQEVKNLRLKFSSYPGKISYCRHLLL